MKPFEELCEDLRAFARAHPDEREAVISDHAVYGAGMDAMIAIAKLNALSKYARDECRLMLYIRNSADEAIRSRTEASTEASASTDRTSWTAEERRRFDQMGPR